jgi:hypothetical protein
MNLFVLDRNPEVAAEYNCDVHCNKVLLEIAQMLANCFTEEKLKYAPKTKTGTARKHSYYNHPVSKWIRNTKENLRWALSHGFALEKERLYRGYNPHFSIDFINWVQQNIEDSVVPDGPLEEFAVAIADNKNCRQILGFNSLDSVEKYRLYYKYDKPFAKWSVRQTPTWF